MRQPSRSRTVAAAIVVAAHLALLIAWTHDAVQWPVSVPPPRISVRLIGATPTAPQALPAAPTMTRPTREPARLVLPAHRADVAHGHAIVTQAIAPGPEPAASQAATAAHETAEPLLDSDATRRAIRASARAPGLAAQAGRFGAAPLSPDERLGAAVQQGARGDCLKGEYLGGGMGLLSLPFLAAAALREQCRR
jgi:hypothetical protein